MRHELIPDEATIYGWIEEIYGHGVRRPGYPADRWAEGWLQERFRAIGLERVRAEPVELPYWEPRAAMLTVTGSVDRSASTGGGACDPFEVPCFALPHAASGEVEAEFVVFDADAPDGVRGAVALCDVPRMRVPHSWFARGATWHYDPDATFETSVHVLPFGREMQDVMEPSMEAGAAAFVGVLSGYPCDSYQYYVPYDARERPIPGVWISGSDGARLRGMVETGPVRARVTVDALREPITSYNIVGELPGADNETVVIGSHHDGPWASAVEDASGMALVLTQAAYWSGVPAAERPHRMLFLLNAGHMAGGAGQASFVSTHRAELDNTVLEVHLEHAAMEYAEVNGALRPTGEPEARWWFTSRIERLEAAVRDAIEREDLRRSLVIKPDMFGEKPTTDGADFHLAGVPLVHYLTSPFYLFDAMDTMDKIHRPSLLPVTRAAIRIVESTTGVSAKKMRAGQLV